MTVAERTPPLDRFVFKPNVYSGNVLVGTGSVAAAAREGFATQTWPVGWTEVQESAALKPLTAEAVGPEWVIALRRAGQFSVEDTAPAERAEPPEARKNKRKR